MPTKKKEPDKKRNHFGNVTEKFLKEKEERRQKARLKKFPTMAMAGRPIPTNRLGAVTPKEKQIIELVLQDQPQDVSAEQVDQLSKLLRRNPQTIKALVQKARDTFSNNAPLYIEVHAKSVQSAYMNGDFDTAAKHAEWAMENIENEGVSIIEAASKSSRDNSPKVLINIPLGGITPTQP